MLYASSFQAELMCTGSLSNSSCCSTVFHWNRQSCGSVELEIYKQFRGFPSTCNPLEVEIWKAQIRPLRFAAQSYVVFKTVECPVYKITISWNLFGSIFSLGQKLVFLREPQAGQPTFLMLQYKRRDILTSALCAMVLRRWLVVRITRKE